MSQEAPKDLFDLSHVPSNEGNVEMVIFPRGGKIIQRFQRPMEVVIYEPANALAIGKQMIDCCVECGLNITIQAPRRKISREKRDALIARAVLINRSMRNKGSNEAVTAKVLVDAILSAID